LRKTKYSVKHTRCGIGYRRALATAVTSAIVLSAVSVMGVMMLQWSNSTIIKQKQEIDEVFNTQRNKIGENLIFENVWFGTSPTLPSPPNNMVNVTMRNVGVMGLNITNMEFINAADLSELHSFTYADGGVMPSRSFSIAAPHLWTSGDVINIIIYTHRGNQFTTQVVAP
jgi:hypothetical protein